MTTIRKARNNNSIQQLEDDRIHNWYRFVLSYPDHLVVQMIDKLNVRRGQTVLDPFVGTGTTLIECKKLGLHSIGIDANPVTAFASRVKTMWDINLDDFARRYSEIYQAIQLSPKVSGDTFPLQLSFNDLTDRLLQIETAQNIDSLDDSGWDETFALIPKDWISPLPFRKIMFLQQIIDQFPQDALTDLFRLALISILVTDASNLGFGPEVYLSKKRQDADVYGAFIKKLNRMKSDIQSLPVDQPPGTTTVFCGDARQLTAMIREPVDFVITSPPYPNEKDYTRITRLELILLGFIHGKDDLRQLKETMLRSHTRNIYVDDNDSAYVNDIPEIQSLAQEIEAERIKRGATSGFEKLYRRVVTEYFGGMYRVLEQLQHVMPIGSKLALVVGDQASYFRVPVQTAKMISLVASRKLAYREVETIVWRTRLATATKANVEEHILFLERK